MDRRPRDVPPEDRYGGGQSYRPGNVRNRSPPPPRRDRDRDSNGFYGRSPPRRPFDSRGPQPGRSRSPLGRETFRRRSPSPRDRFGVPRGGDSYRARSRTPPRRVGNDDRDFRDNRRFGDDRAAAGRSPPRGIRERSPPLQNGVRTPLSAGGRKSPLPRRFSPPARRFDDHPPARPRSPPRRGFSPRDYPSRPRSPISRNDIGTLANRNAESWRRQTPPQPGDVRLDRDQDRGRESIGTSRRSSPPLHASRLALIQDQEGTRSGRPSPRPNHADQGRDRDGDVSMQDSHVRREERPPVHNDVQEQRLPPSGPRETRAPPSGPRATTIMPVIPPAGPRADAGPSRGGFASRGRGAYSVDFTGRGRGAPPATYQADRAPALPFGRGASYEREPSDIVAPSPSSSTAPVPQGPRTYTSQQPRPGMSRAPSIISQSSRYDAAAEAPREPRASAQSNYYRRPTEPGIIPSGPAGDRSREIRRVDNGIHPALRDLPEVVTNGRKLPPIVDQTRLGKLEDDSERLRKAVQEKEAKKRKSLREWDRLVREAESAAFRSEVAEESVRAYELEAEGTGLAF